MIVIQGRDLSAQVSELESETGTIPPIQKILLLTDGSVTNLLEVITGERVGVQTLVQAVMPAGKEQATRLGITEGDPVNHRVVNLSGSRTGAVFMRAISDTPLSRLMPAFRQDLMAADIPIGRILMRYRMETRREILDIRASPAGPELSAVFGISPGDLLLSRHYHIVHDSHPLISIEEIFPLSGMSFGIPTGSAGGPGRTVSSASYIAVNAPSRLHLGLIDLNGQLGRVDGGIGVTIADPCTLIEAARGNGLSVTGGDPGSRDRVVAAAGRMYRHLGLVPQASIRIRNSVAAHIGFGSGTQIALATGTAICGLHGVSLSAREIASVVNRGGTSGIGTAAFETGGFILDGGHSFGTSGEKQMFRPSSASPGVHPPPVCARLPFPPQWHIVLVIPGRGTRVEGKAEVDIFSRFCPVPLEEVRTICHEIVVRVLPGIAEQDIDLFAPAINSLQGLGFKKSEISLQDPIVPALMQGLIRAGAACAGLTSFGPTVYAITDDDPAAIGHAADEILGGAGGTVVTTRGRNSGAMVTVK